MDPTAAPAPDAGLGTPPGPLLRLAVWLGRLALSLAIVFAAAAAGRLVAAATGLPIPSSLWGMAVLLALLASGVVRLSWVETGAGLLLAQMSLFFVPPAVGLIQSLEVLAREWPALLVGSLATTLALLAAVGRIEEGKG